MRRLLVIGIGVGDPDHLTLAAVKALREVDVFFVPNKGSEKADLKLARLDLITRHARHNHRMVEFPVPPRERNPADYEATVADWHEDLARTYARAFVGLAPDETGGILVWGDPSLYDSTLRIVATVRAHGEPFALDVIPGITAVQALCARHQIPLNRIGEPVLLTTGRRLAAGWPEGADSVLVMLDGDETFAQIADAGACEIFWGAYLGTPDECLMAGRLIDVRDAIVALRQAARARKGWIMDTYLLRRC